MISATNRLVLLALALLAHDASSQPMRRAATYSIHLSANAPTRIRVNATVPSNGSILAMADSRPGDIPEVADAGWPALVRNLKVTDARGRAVTVTNAGANGWTLSSRVTGLLTLTYDVDYAPLAARGWPAMREAAFADADHLIVIGRSVFITTPAQRESDVRFTSPRGWQVVTPWPATHGSPVNFTVASTDDLSENLIAFSHEAPDVLSAGGFNLRVVALGHWQPARSEVRRVLGAALKRIVAMIGFNGHASYMVVLLPQVEHGGESFRESFALTLEADPSRANSNDWGNTVAHEVFHYWNGWRLKGADYMSSQWFQEGFTEYAANLTLVSAGLTTPDQFYAKLAGHVTKYRALTTALDAPGTHKGPPLYSGGALVAFTWDTMIREATHGEHGVFDMMRVLLRNTGEGARPYSWADIQIALESIAPGSWDDFHRRYIHGTEQLPVADALVRIGLRMTVGNEGAVTIAPALNASAASGTLRRQLLGAGIRR